MVRAPPGARGRRHRHDLIGVGGSEETFGDDAGQVRREDVPAAELEGDENVARYPAVGRGAPQASVRRRRENAPSAARRFGVLSGDAAPAERLIADGAPVRGGPLEPIPAALADAAPKKAFYGLPPAAQTPGRKKEIGGGPQNRVQISLREAGPASVNIGVGL